ncbi:hypothetical protein N7478_006186 [Penicillium angulare]|uniref:uncharacterized protein n=1 Tax=Penicillium angulare TaxID=116970 RepID=UPI00253F6CDC|nr:uncharacterized protein N7478_006186 [Penicillium angulare]KAJ5280814.1 hypothetical protein N7478_006186 [Penicillium angulare]
MSESLRAAPLSDHAIQDRSAIDNEHGPVGNLQSRRPSLRARPQSWHPYGPVEPPFEASSSRSIGVHSILNPPAQTTMEAAINSGIGSRSASRAASPRARKGSSPAIRPMNSIMQHPLSPRSAGRPLMNPGSPSARFVGGGRSGQSSVSQSPLVPHESSLGLRQPVSSPLPNQPLRPLAAMPGTLPPVAGPLHSTPSIHARRTSAGPAPLTKPTSQEASPTSPHSTYSQFGRASPAIANVSIAPSPASYSTASTPYMTMETLTRGTPAVAPPRSIEEQTTAPAPAASSQAQSAGPSTPGSTSSLPGLIPCVLDLKSGSTSQAEKRKANSDASRRFRNRKRNEMQLEQRLTSQQDEIRRQSEEIRSLLQQRDHYRSERDFFRDYLGRSMSLSQVPPRPTSPRSSSVIPAPLLPTPVMETAPTPTWSGGDAVRSAPGEQSTSRPQASWPGTPVPCAAVPQEPMPRAIGSDAGSSALPVSGGPLPPFQGSWSRQ